MTFDKFYNSIDTGGYNITITVESEDGYSNDERSTDPFSDYHVVDNNNGTYFIYITFYKHTTNGHFYLQIFDQNNENVDPDNMFLYSSFSTIISGNVCENTELEISFILWVVDS